MHRGPCMKKGTFMTASMSRRSKRDPLKVKPPKWSPLLYQLPIMPAVTLLWPSAVCHNLLINPFTIYANSQEKPNTWRERKWAGMCR